MMSSIIPGDSAKAVAEILSEMQTEAVMPRASQLRTS